MTSLETKLNTIITELGRAVSAEFLDFMEKYQSDPEVLPYLMQMCNQVLTEIHDGINGKSARWKLND